MTIRKLIKKCFGLHIFIIFYFYVIYIYYLNQLFGFYSIFCKKEKEIYTEVMNKGIACGTGAPCHINNEYQVLFYFTYVYMYICILFFLSFNRNKSGLGRRIKRKKIFLITNFS